MGHSTDEGWWEFMGDRCWLQLELRGNIDSAFTLVRVAKAILTENLTDEVDVGETTVRDIIKHIADCVSCGAEPDFTGFEVNYANIEDLEIVLQKLGVTYAVNHTAGGDYGAGRYSWHPDRGRVEAPCLHDGLPAVEAHTIREALKKGTLEGVLESLDHAEGKDLAAFTVSGTAERMIAKLQAVTALKVA